MKKQNHFGFDIDPYDWRFTGWPMVESYSDNMKHKWTLYTLLHRGRFLIQWNDYAYGYRKLYISIDNFAGLLMLTVSFWVGQIRFSFDTSKEH